MYRVYVPESYSFLNFFIFLSLQFSNINNFVALLSGIVSARKLKFGKHMYNGWMYRLYRSPAAAAAYSSLFIAPL